MKFFCDQDVYAQTVKILRQDGHDVTTASERGMATATDAELLAKAPAEDRLFVTRDRDFGGLVFSQAARPGVVYLRITAGAIAAAHAELLRVLKVHPEAALAVSFVEVEPGRHRIRRVP